MITVLGQVQTRRDTSANWAYVNPVLALGVIGIDTTVKNFKVGDGVTHWSGLPYYIPGATAVVQIPFTSTTPGAINWQTDIPPGYGDTYANLLGNYFPKPVIAVLVATDGVTGKKTYDYPGGMPQVVTNSDGTIDTVTFDFSVGDGYVRF